MAHPPYLTARQRTALSVPPLLLRLVLAAIFIWAGYAKIFGTFEVTDENRPALIAAGVLGQPTVVPPVTETESAPIVPPDVEPDDEPVDEPSIPDEEPVDDPEPVSPVEPAPAGDPGPSAEAEPGEVLMVAQSQGSPTTVRMLSNIATMLHAGANPQPVVNDDGTTTTPMALVPDALGSPPWALRLAWAAAVTELVAGLLLLIGLFTRLAGLSVAWVMGVAIWMTAIGPAIQSGNAFLGFLPQPDLLMTHYHDLFFQLALFAMGLALLFSGGGMLSLDRWIFGKSVADDDD
jgi:uncharacterized membrane protein YphA (DoxX/SURF4 family)